MPSKLGAHAFHSNLYLYKFYKPIQFFDHTNYMYSPWSEREFWPNLKQKNEQKSPKPEGPYPNFLSRFYFDPHGL